MRRFLLIALLLLAPAARPSFADDEAEKKPDEKIAEARERWSRLTEEQRKRILEEFERWRNLSEEERRRREEIFEKHLDGATHEEREELLERLRRVKERRDLEELRRKQERAREVGERFREDLPPEARRRLDALPTEQREMLIGHSIGRMSAILRERFDEELTEEERQELQGLRGPARGRRIQELREKRALAGLTATDRERIAALDPAARRTEVLRVLARVHEEDLAAARRQAVTEAVELLELPSGERVARIRRARLEAVLAEHGIRDARLLDRLSRLPPERIRPALAKLREIAAIEDPAERRRAIAQFRDRLPD